MESIFGRGHRTATRERFDVHQRADFDKACIQEKTAVGIYLRHFQSANSRNPASIVAAEHSPPERLEEGGLTPERLSDKHHMALCDLGQPANAQAVLPGLDATDDDHGGLWKPVEQFGALDRGLAYPFHPVGKNQGLFGGDRIPEILS